MDSTEKFIRDAAAAGWSRKMTREALDITDCTWRNIQAALPDIKWPAANTSIDRKAVYESMRGECGFARLDSLKAAHAARRANSKHYQIGDTFAIMADQLIVWKEHITVSSSQIRRRLDDGMNVYDAFFLPPLVKRKPQSGWRNARNRIECKNHAADPADRAAEASTRAFLADRIVPGSY